MSTGFVAQQPVAEEQQRERQSSDRDKLEEPVPGVLGIRQVGRLLDQSATTEEVAELHDDESEKEQVEDGQRHVELERAETSATPEHTKPLHLHEPAFLPWREEVPQKTGRQPRE